MPSQPPIPHLLTPYVTPPRSSLSLVTSVLSATGNWLVLRILFAALGTGRNGATPGIGLQSGDGVGEFGGSRKKVVLLSFLRGWDFWKSEAKRLVSTLLKILCVLIEDSHCPASFHHVWEDIKIFIFCYVSFIWKDLQSFCALVIMPDLFLPFLLCEVYTISVRSNQGCI